MPFFTGVAFLIDPDQKPRFWAKDITYGRNAGGREVMLRPVFIKPGHPLADFAGLLGPPRRLLGRYIGFAYGLAFAPHKAKLVSAARNEKRLEA